MGLKVRQWLRPFATLIAVVALATIFSPTRDGFPIFWNADNQLNILRQVSEIGILATAMTLVIICGGIDLSVGSLLALSGTIFAYTFARKDWPLAMAVGSALFATTAFGLASGAIIARLRMQPFIVTLAAMIGSRGFARWVVDNATIDVGFGTGYVDRVVGFIALKRVVVPAFLVVAMFGYGLLRFTRFGRYLVAVGGSEVAARLSGINVSWVKLRVYALSGFLAGIAGIIHACQNHQGSPNAGVAYELDAIAAAVIGGTSLAGGKGGIVGTVVGTLALGILSNLLGLNNVDENTQWMLKALIIVGAVWLQSVGARKETLA
ncbi:MAG: ABC transporter permease [Candidatus Hydrogenedentes bacterium]|nr:ABC transporter permease [Candidatus Hydrogenedentota bacterium]